MELELRNGKVVWVKGDGTTSKTPVNTMTMIIKFCGFPEPLGPQRGVCKSLEVLDGDPLKNEIILVKAFGNSWGGKFLLSKRTGEYVRIGEEAVDYAEKLIKEPPKGSYSLKEIMEQKAESRRKAVDIEALAQEKGLRVWEARHFDGYWCREQGEFNDLPEGWHLLPKGDTALTRMVRKGPYWILMKWRKMRQGEAYSEELGTVAPGENIERAFRELGGEEGAAERAKSKERAQGKREERFTEKLEDAIIRCFPKIPRQDLDEIVGRARSPGAVGTAQWLYFATVKESQEVFDSAANLAVRAHVRHKYTNYDKLLADSEFADNENRMDARSAVADKIDKVLSKWR